MVTGAGQPQEEVNRAVHLAHDLLDVDVVAVEMFQTTGKPRVFEQIWVTHVCRYLKHLEGPTGETPQQVQSCNTDEVGDGQSPNTSHGF